jgi:hypothetical protein
MTLGHHDRRSSGEARRPAVAHEREAVGEGHPAGSRVSAARWMSEWSFNGWSPIGRTIVVGVIAYAVVIVLLRFGGKRTLANVDEFDLGVTIAIGSMSGTAMLSQDALTRHVQTISYIVFHAPFGVLKCQPRTRSLGANVQIRMGGTVGVVKC